MKLFPLFLILLTLSAKGASLTNSHFINIDASGYVHISNPSSIDTALIVNSSSVPSTNSLQIGSGTNYATKIFVSSNAYWGGFFSSVSLGTETFDPALTGENAGIFTFGDGSGLGQTLIDSYYVFNLGAGVGVDAIYNNSGDVYSYATGSGVSQILTNSYGIHNFGLGSGDNQVLNDSEQIYNFGEDSGLGQVLTTSIRAFNIGDGAGRYQTLDNSQDVYNIGKAAGQSQALTNSFDVYAIGELAGASLSGNGLSHVFQIGSGAIATGSNQFVLGDTAYEYIFNGTALNFNGGTGSSKFSINSAGAVTLASTVTVGSVTKVQKTALTPTNGMMVYQTDNTPGFRLYVNGAWVIVSTAADP